MQAFLPLPNNTAARTRKPHLDSGARDRVPPAMETLNRASCAYPHDGHGSNQHSGKHNLSQQPHFRYTSHRCRRDRVGDRAANMSHSNGIPVSILPESDLRHFRLLELPAELLALVTSESPPMWVQLNAIALLHDSS